jgi:zinc transport system permease protein
MLILAGSAAVLGLLRWRWNRLLITTVNRDLAHASGINPKREQLVLNLAIAIVIAASIQVVGALLISAFLIIPAASARNLASSPERMAIAATLTAIVASGLGLVSSFSWDTPTGATIVSACALLFVASSLFGAVRSSPR